MAYTEAETAAMKARFLEEFRLLGNVRLGAQAAGVHRRLVYRWKEADEAFAEELREAQLEAVEVLEGEAQRRALEGATSVRRVYDRTGTLIARREEVRYSDALLIFLLKAWAPEKYRERFDHRLANGDGSPLFPLAALREALADADDPAG